MFFQRFQHRLWLLLSLLSLSACALCCPTVTAPAFERIPIGASITEVETQIGPPYKVTTPQPGTQIYHYIERIETGPGVISQNTYLLTVIKGQIVDKQCASDSQALRLQMQ